MKHEYLGLILLIIGILVMVFGYILNAVFYPVGSFIIGVGLATMVK